MSEMNIKRYVCLSRLAMNNEKKGNGKNLGSCETFELVMLYYVLNLKRNR
jgi:hypothetical protein